ncbi:MAG: hypothetical protein AB1705_19055 [Verrucomicrobiota bacterium]
MKDKLTRRKHLVLVVARLLGMLVIAVSGIVALGSPPPGAEERAPGVAGMLFVGGVVLAVVYGIIATAVHYFLRQKPLLTLLMIDAILAAGFVLFMAYTGAQARFSKQPETKAARIDSTTAAPWTT